MIRNIRSRLLFTRYSRFQFCQRSVASISYETNKSIFDPERFTFPNDDQKQWDQLVKEYTRLLLKEDVPTAIKHLQELEHCNDWQKDKVRPMLELIQAGLDVYNKSNTRHSFKEIIDVIQRYIALLRQMKNEMHEESLKQHIDTTLKTLLHAYYIDSIHGKKGILMLPIQKTFDQIVDEFGVDLVQLSKRLADEHLRNSLMELRPKTSDLEYPKKVSDPNIIDVPIEPYLDDSGNLHFESACRYITDNKFRWNGEPIVSCYKFYDALPTDQKSIFVQSYLSFNKSKQSNLEQYTHKLIKSPSKFNAISEKSAKFIASQHELIKTWVDSSCEKIKSSMMVKSPASHEEKVLYQFQQFIQVFPLISIVGHIIHKLISSAYRGQVGVLEVLNDMRSVFRRDIILMKRSDNRAQLFKFISDDEFDKFSSILIRSVIESCTLPKELANINESKESNTKLNSPFYLDTIYTSPTKSKVFIKIHPALSQSLTAIPIGSDSHHFPLLCPPEPWLGVNRGAYLERSTPFLSGVDKLQQTILTNAQHQGKLDSAFKCLDQMGKTAWAINPEMLSVFNKVIDLPQGFLNIPPKVVDEANKSKQEVIDLKGLRSNFETVNMLANAFGRNGDMLYHCYVFDFRGRVYPLSPLTHYGGDLTRSLFQFWFGQPLGLNGLYWVKYQLLSVFGGSCIDCEEFYNQNRANIIDSATDPLQNRWWMKADEPFSALSVCIELKNILEFVESGKGSVGEYMCRLPIHQDGSCNGLQHYAALAADELGGKAVNLVPVDSKQDVYSTVRDIVERKIINDVTNGKLSEVHRDHAKFILSILDRNLIKRPVMTTVYGVTLVGASRQILENVEKIVSDHDENPSKRGLYDEETIDRLRSFNLKSTMYLARKILSSIDELFHNAKQMERWLVQNVRRILTGYNVKTLDYLQSKSHASSSLTFTSAAKSLEDWYKSGISYIPISWISASGFPVLQTYRKKQQPHSVAGALGSIMQSASSKHAPMDRRKHELAIAPNFIHSLDASHMFMTCDACAGEEEGVRGDDGASRGSVGSVTFASIHDSYWTHASQVETLSQILRQTFVKLHSFDYMSHVRDDFVSQVEHLNLFQLVYFNKSEWPNLYDDLKSIRSGYEGEYGKMSEVLNHELRQVHEMRQDHPISQLLNQHNPKLFHIVGNNIYNYNPNVEDSERVQLDKSYRKQLVPVFVPLQILNLPKKGTLDIRYVLESKYFFS
ncbi:hypothetical protein KGF57_003538 [Candida theae]|uniref:DNA-directed RNA polymerase n=1 Tax=Candida theae TaxID=1198502 RepID=A0AAD5BD07_9ASCO|nr:uncharacterized protein KGF57_003538 [Candida theae]KAI5956052.1 hypothetical protein KGF57_003538 [Candida theae]